MIIVNSFYALYLYLFISPASVYSHMKALSERRSGTLAILLSASALIAGGSIYILFREGEFIFHRWLQAVWPAHWINPLPATISCPGLHFPTWVIYSLPNGLWALAYALLVTSIWLKSRSILKYFWLGTIPLLVMGFELLQWAGVLRGTFCLEDLALGIAGIVAGALTGLGCSKKRYPETNLNNDFI